MRQHFIDQNGNYFVAIIPINTPSGATPVPQRPAPHWAWQNGAWVEGDLPLPEVPQKIAFAQLLIGLVMEGWITESEGNAWLEGRIPDAAELLIATLPEEQRFAARARASRPSVVMRDDPLVIALAASQGHADDLDRFFTIYAEV